MQHRQRDERSLRPVSVPGKTLPISLARRGVVARASDTDPSEPGFHFSAAGSKFAHSAWLQYSQLCNSKIQDSKDVIVHLKHHIKNGNCSSVTQ